MEEESDVFTDAATGDGLGVLMGGCVVTTTAQCVEACALGRFIRLKFIFYFTTES